MQEVVKSVIQRNDKYLLIKRSPDSSFFASLWDFPGGKLEKDETLEQCVQRETEEETDFVVEPIKKVGDYVYKENNWPIHFNVFSVKIISGEIKLGEDHTDYKWVSIEEIKNMDVAPVVKLFLVLK